MELSSNQQDREKDNGVDEVQSNNVTGHREEDGGRERERE